MKTIKLELPEGKLTEEVIAQLRTKLEEAIAGRSEAGRAEARKQTEELIAQLRSQGPALVSAQAVLAVVRACMKELDELPRTIRAIAQSLDTPGHIFELGGAASEMIAACGLLSLVERTLEETIACDHCQPEPEPSKENLS